MKTMKFYILVVALMLGVSGAQAKIDYNTDKKYLELRDSMHHAFNDADSARFFPALLRLEDYLLEQNDMHGYYTQRCNEIVFQMNRQKIFEAYKLARQLSEELREKKLDSEMYMAYNMMGHINRYCGNKETAKKNFYHVIELMEKSGYYESMPPIYMNIVNVSIDDDHEEAMRLLDKAKSIAEKYAPQRVFDIESRKILSYFNGGDIPSFLKGYEEYRKGVAEGKSSVHGRSIEVYYLASQGKTDEAVALAKEELGEESHSTITKIYERAGRWKEAYESLKQEAAADDSISNVVLTNSMEGIRDQLEIYDIQKQSAHNKMVALFVSLVLLTLLVGALTYIAITRRKHLRELRKAYEHALESDRMKTAFIQNVSHEVRTPLNIISGFAQIIANPEMTQDKEEQQHMAQMMQKNTHQITTLIDEMLEMSLNESTEDAIKDDVVNINGLLRQLIRENESLLPAGVAMTLDSTLPDDFTMQTSKQMLRRIISGLLDNAIKNTEQGAITLKASAHGVKLSLAVEDTGCGVPAEKAEHIFERFYKVDSFKEGIGLGLTLCRRLAERLGGTVKLDTAYAGPGARFVVTLPVGSDEWN